LMDSTYSTSSFSGLVSSKRRLVLPPNSAARPKLRQIDLAWPICRYPFGSGGNRVWTRPPNLLVFKSSRMISRMKFEGPLWGLDGVIGISNFRLQLIDGLPDAAQADRLPQNFQSGKQRRSRLAAAHGDADGLEHLARLDAQALSGIAQGRFQRVVRELGGRQRFGGLLQDARG